MYKEAVSAVQNVPKAVCLCCDSFIVSLFYLSATSFLFYSRQNRTWQAPGHTCIKTDVPAMRDEVCVENGLTPKRIVGSEFKCILAPNRCLALCN